MSYTGNESWVEPTKAEMLEELKKLVNSAFVLSLNQYNFTIVQVPIYRNVLGFIQATKTDGTNWSSNSNNRLKITLDKQLPGYDMRCDYTDGTCKDEWVNMMNSSFVTEKQVNAVLNKLKPKCNAGADAASGACAIMGGRRTTRKTKKTKKSKRSKSTRGRR